MLNSALSQPSLSSHVQGRAWLSLLVIACGLPVSHRGTEKPDSAIVQVKAAQRSQSRREVTLWIVSAFLRLPLRRSAHTQTLSEGVRRLNNGESGNQRECELHLRKVSATDRKLLLFCRRQIRQEFVQATASGKGW